MTIGMWLLLALGSVVLAGGIVLGAYFFSNQEIALGVSLLIIAMLIGGAMLVGPIVYSGTEAGKRAMKDQESNFGSGIERTVEVYDIQGELIKEYSGKFDIETDNKYYLLFDDENGKRHIIYYSTATVVIDEK